MIKLVAFLKRKPGLTREEFEDHWLHRHAPLIANTPELARHIVRYEQHRRTPDHEWMGSPEYDGITIQWMESPKSFEAFVNEPKYLELIYPDEERFLDRDGICLLYTSPSPRD